VVNETPKKQVIIIGQSRRCGMTRLKELIESGKVHFDDLSDIEIELHKYPSDAKEETTSGQRGDI
jgi:hypothetical protein